MRILILVAGMSDPSNVETLADAFVEGTLEARGGVEVVKLRLRDLQIDHFRVDYYDPRCSAEEDFCRVQDLLQRADGVVIATPVWNFSVPGHLKNLIDRMGSFALDATRTKGMLRGKPFFLIFTTGAPWTAWAVQKHTTGHLPWAIQFFGGKVAGVHVETSCVVGPGRFGLVVDHRPESLARARRLGTRFVRDIASGRVRHHGNLVLTCALTLLKCKKAIARVMWGRG